jgi:hypothetical protein
MFGHFDISNILPLTGVSIFFFFNLNSPKIYAIRKVQALSEYRVRLQAKYTEARLQLYVWEIPCHNATDLRLCSTTQGMPQRRKQGLRTQQDLQIAALKV